jgi:hypothetical protein
VTTFYCLVCKSKIKIQSLKSRNIRDLQNILLHFHGVQGEHCAPKALLSRRLSFYTSGRYTTLDLTCGRCTTFALFALRLYSWNQCRNERKHLRAPVSSKSDEYSALLRYNMVSRTRAYSPCLHHEARCTTRVIGLLSSSEKKQAESPGELAWQTRKTRTTNGRRARAGSAQTCGARFKAYHHDRAFEVGKHHRIVSTRIVPPSARVVYMRHELIREWRPQHRGVSKEPPTRRVAVDQTQRRFLAQDLLQILLLYRSVAS